jgi:hypothetical protein
MTLDSEIHASWEADPGDPRDRTLRAAIRRVRARLLLEHIGEGAHVRTVVLPEHLVTRLDAVAAARRGRLRLHPKGDEVPSLLARAVHELAWDYLDPKGGVEPLTPPPSARCRRQGSEPGNLA